MRRLPHSLLAGALWLTSLALAPGAFAQNKVEPQKQGPLFTGKELAEPPQTGQPWTPPASQLPAVWESSLRLLLKYGFADPRGCDYREVEVTCGRVWSNQGQLAKTHAWVLPAAADAPPDTPRFAVTWSGLVYPVVSVGAAADWRADVERQLKTPPGRRQLAIPEPEAISYDHASALKGCILFLLGEPELAEKTWKIAGPIFRPTRPGGPPVAENGDPYLELVNEWGWAHFDRAVCAHLRGDDVVSLASARLLPALRDAVEQEARRRGFTPPNPLDNHPQKFLEFLANVESLVNDETRRVGAAPVERVLAPGAAAIASPEARIAALISDLEVVDETQMGQPGGVYLGHAEIVVALIGEGSAAVDPLLECFEKDPRLTRSIEFARDFGTMRGFIGVDRAAFVALQGILKTRTFGPQTNQGYFPFLSPAKNELRRSIAVEIRDFWNKSKGKTDEERWYSTLCDANATDKQWIEAAESITQRVPPSGQKGKIPPITVERADGRALGGEALRNRKNPSVAELLAQRANQIAALDPNDTRRIFHLHDACTVTLCLARWDSQAALPAIRQRIEQYHALANDRFYKPYVKQLENPVSQLMMVAIDGDGPEFVETYVAWMDGLRPDRADAFGGLAVFGPLGRFPDEPKLAKLAERLFSEGSPWLPLPERLGHDWYRLLSSSLVGVPAFRELIKTELRNKAPFGTVKVLAAEPMLELQFAGTTMRQRVAEPLDAADPSLSDAKPVRVCDFVAWRVSFLPGAPVYGPFWSAAKRDTALPGVAEFLDARGNAFRDRGAVSDRFIQPFSAAKISIPKLDHAATPADVAAGRAIFSLPPGAGAVRVVDLPAFPQPARWKTLDDFPIQTPGPKDAQTGQPAQSKSFDRDGSIWQAEEVEVDGHRTRFYGFVGRHVIAKVPAEEIELLAVPGAD